MAAAPAEDLYKGYVSKSVIRGVCEKTTPWKRGGKTMCFCSCNTNYCDRCKSIATMAIGALILINAYGWPGWTGIDNWIAYFGVLILIGGLITYLKPTCGCESHAAQAAKPVMKNKK
jgi:hypothetical protein